VHVRAVVHARPVLVVRTVLLGGRLRLVLVTMLTGLSRCVPRGLDRAFMVDFTITQHAHRGLERSETRSEHSDNRRKLNTRS